MAAQLRPYDFLAGSAARSSPCLLRRRRGRALEVAQRMTRRGDADLVDETVSYTVSIGLTRRYRTSIPRLDALYNKATPRSTARRRRPQSREAAKAGGGGDCGLQATLIFRSGVPAKTAGLAALIQVFLQAHRGGKASVSARVL